MPITKVRGGYQWDKSEVVHKKRSDALYEARGSYINKQKPSRIRLVDKHGKPSKR